MKKVLFFSALLFTGILSQTKAQDTLLYEGFQFVMDSYLVEGPPTEITVDSMWYNFDRDGLTDGSGGSSTRPGGWFQILPFADADSTVPGTVNDTNIVMAANSWFDAPGLADNWLITTNIQLGDHDTLFWESAPRQTPRYCDGYEVLLSTTTNSDLVFNHVLFTAAQMDEILGTNDSIFAGYSFTPSGTFVHGLDGTYTEFDADSARLIGQLKPFWVALDDYANQNVFIAFHHNSYDDNLISIDNILIRGTASNPVAGIKENSAFDLSLNLFPNPASENVQVNFTINAQTPVTISLYDVTGKLVYSESKEAMSAGRHFANISTGDLAKGFYTVAVQTQNSKNTSKLIVR